MATSREKKKVIVNITNDQAEQAFADYSKASSSIKKLTAEIEMKCTKIREGYSTDLDKHAVTKEENFAILQTFAMEQEKLFEKKKSFEMTHGTIGFRTTTPAAKTLKGFTWPSVVNLIKEFLGEKYVRTKEEADKELLIADRDNPEVNQHFKKCGIEIRQEETFFVEPKEEQVPA